MGAPIEIFIQENDNSMMYGINQDSNIKGMIKYIRADLAITADDVWCIFNLVRDLQTKYSATEGCLQEVADIFNEQRKK